MSFPAKEERIAAAERELGVTFPDELRRRLLFFNGGDVAVEDWPELLTLYPVRDDSDRRHLRRTAVDVVSENRGAILEELRASGDFPADAVAIAKGDGGDFLVLTAEGGYALWLHGTAELEDAAVLWLLPEDELPPGVEGYES